MNTDTQNNKNENRGFVRNAVLLVAAAIGTAYGGVPLNNLLWEQLSMANRVRFCPSAFRFVSRVSS